MARNHTYHFAVRGEWVFLSVPLIYSEGQHHHTRYSFTYLRTGRSNNSPEGIRNWIHGRLRYPASVADRVVDLLFPENHERR